MIGIIGKNLILLAFVSSILAMLFYYLDAKSPRKSFETAAKVFFSLKGVAMIVASGLLIYLIFTHQFDFYYVFNYTSLDLQAQYLAAAFYSGQEGSFMLWIVFSFFVGLGLMKWTHATYRSAMLFFFSITQFFLISMLLGVDIAGTTFGASPFRTLQEQMPHLPVWQTNPGFTPADGSGLNDLLRSPWIVIHPPVIFIGFAMMTIPYAFALAALWKRAYQDWIYPALPWALGANLALLIAIFLGGYWAYETLSFGGYWAWDPVENASLVPWIVGMAGIHTMLVQRRSANSKKASLIFAILAYILVVYQTFLTRSGVLGEASVHSFVDLGLYNQLLAFMLTMVALGVGFFIVRYREMSQQYHEFPILSKEFMMFMGALLLFLSGLVIILGTSSPILGRLFVDNPTPPEMNFYNNWSIPFAILISIASVLTQYLWWKKIGSVESLAEKLMWPTLVTAIVSVATIMLGGVHNPIYMIYILAGWFGVIGNAWVMMHILGKKPRMIGGTLTHIGFTVMLLGFMGAAFDRPMLDQDTREYNAAVLRGEVNDKDGFPVIQTINMVELKIDEPKYIDDRYWVTFVGGEVTEKNRPGESEYTIKFEDTKRNGRVFFLTPIMYPMVANSQGGTMNWTVDPEIKLGWISDMYAYVAGSSIVERLTKDQNQSVIPISQIQNGEVEGETRIVRVKRGGYIQLDDYKVLFSDFEFMAENEYPVNATIAVRAILNFESVNNNTAQTIKPEFAIIRENDQNVTLAPPLNLGNSGIVVQFTNVNPQSEEIELRITGFSSLAEPDWVLLTIEKKPFVSVVWIGTFLLMIGFSVSIYRRWNDQKRRESLEKNNADTDDDNLAYD
jgi:cytochrome c-type biogenesis protein CcmF